MLKKLENGEVLVSFTENEVRKCWAAFAGLVPIFERNYENAEGIIDKADALHVLLFGMDIEQKFREMRELYERKA